MDVVQAIRRVRASVLLGLLARVLLVTLLVARLAHVWAWRDAYRAAPWSLLNLADGGWSLQAGVIGGWLFALLALRERPALLRRRALMLLAMATLVGMCAAVLRAREQFANAQLNALPLRSVDGSGAGGFAALADFKGRPTVVNLWATWCAPCVREMPLLQAAQRQHPQLHFVFLNQGEAAPRVQGFLLARGLVLQNVLLDSTGAAAREFNAGALPTTLFFDAQGRLVSSQLGELTAPALQAQLARIAS